MADGSISERRHPRVDVRMNIRISTIDPELDPGSGKAYFRTSEETCLTLSRGGAFVVAREPVAKGQRLLMEMEIPGGPNLQTIGRVAWSKTVTAPGEDRSESRLGVEFLGGSPEQLSALDGYVSRSVVSRDKKARPLPPAPSPSVGGSA